MSRLTLCLLVVAALLSLGGSSVACSMAGCLNDGDEMRPSFTVMVTHDGKPLSGVNFHILAKGAEQFSGITDESGIVHVHRLAPGLYWLNADFLATGVAHTCFHVGAKASRSAKAKLTYAWGDEAPATSRIAGKLVDSQPGKGGTPIWNLVHRTDVPIVGAGLILQDPLTHAVYRTTSGEEGTFSFEALPNGTYVLHIEGGSAGDHTYDPTDAVISLNPTARRSRLVFKRSEPSGGSCAGMQLELQSN